MLHLTPPGCDSNKTCTVIGDYEDSISDLKDWSESHEGKIMVTKPSIYLTGASYAVYEGIGNAEKVKFEDSPVMLDKTIKNDAEFLASYRSEQLNSAGPSFTTIAAFGANSA